MYFCHWRVFYPPSPSAISSISLPVTKQRPKCPANALVSDTFLPTTQNHRLAATHLSNLARSIDEFIAEQEWSNIIYDCETKWKRVGGEIKWYLKDELWIFCHFLSTKRECLIFCNLLEICKISNCVDVLNNWINCEMNYVLRMYFEIIKFRISACILKQ